MNILDLADQGFAALPIDRESTDALLAAGDILLGSVRSELGTFGGGEPSAPGQPPRIASGELYRSVRKRVIRRTKSTRSDKVRVGTNLPQAPALEFGMVKGVRVRKKGGGTSLRTMAPRPFMRPALEKVKTQMTGTMLVKMRARGVRELRNQAAERASREEFAA
jgi:hypothetical protein